MVFEDAYDGKHFNKRLTLRNHGKTTAFIRILSPKSHVSHYTVGILNHIMDKNRFAKKNV